MSTATHEVSLGAGGTFDTQAALDQAVAKYWSKRGSAWTKDGRLQLVRVGRNPEPTP